MAIRHIYKFTSFDGSAYSYSFPRSLYVWQPSQPLRSAYARIPGAHYAVDRFGSGTVPRDLARESVRFALYNATPATLETEMTNLRAKLYLGAHGKLWLRDSNAAELWAPARVEAMPEITVSWERPHLVPAAADFIRARDWAATSLTTVNQLVTSNNQEWTVANGGALPAELMVVTLTPGTATGLRPHTITNLTNGYAWTHNRTSSATTQRLRLDTERAAVEWSVNSGSSYSNDFPNYTLPTAHAVLAFRLEPGNNTIRYTCTGTPNVTVSFAFYARYP